MKPFRQGRVRFLEQTALTDCASPGHCKASRRSRRSDDGNFDSFPYFTSVYDLVTACHSVFGRSDAFPLSKALSPAAVFSTLHLFVVLLLCMLVAIHQRILTSTTEQRDLCSKGEVDGGPTLSTIDLVLFQKPYCLCLPGRGSIPSLFGQGFHFVLTLPQAQRDEIYEEPCRTTQH